MRLPVRCGRGRKQPAAKLIARNPGPPAGVLFLMRHGSRLPREQRLGRDDRATADADSAKAAGRDMSVESRSSQARRAASFPNAISNLRRMVFDRLHVIGPTRPAPNWRGLHGTASYVEAECVRRRFNSRAFWPDKKPVQFNPTQFAMILTLQVRRVSGCPWLAEHSSDLWSGPRNLPDCQKCVARRFFDLLHR